MPAIEEKLLMPPKIKIVGIGGGGCKLAQAFYKHNETTPLNLQYCVVDTNIQSLEDCARSSNGKIETLCLGQKYFRGFNSGGDLSKIQEIASDSTTAISSIFQQSDLIILLTTLGGGVGNGLTSVMAKAAMAQGAYVMVVALLPFEFEGLNRSTQATQVIKQLNVVADLVFTIPNNLLFQVLPPSATVNEAFQQSNLWVCELLEFILNPIYSQTFGFNSFLKHFSDKPDIVFFAWGTSEQQNSCSEALEGLWLSPFWKILESPMAIKNLFIHTFAEQDIPLQELKDAYYKLQNRFENKQLNVFTAHQSASKQFEKLKIFILATGHSYNLQTYRHRQKNTKNSNAQTKASKEQTHFAFSPTEDDDYFDTPTYLRKGIKIDG